MTSWNRRNAIVTILTVTLAAWIVTPLRAGAPSEMTFLHISDMHINPQPVGAPEPGPDARSVGAIGWICQEAGKPQALTPAGTTAPPPAFVIATGDLTEYGVIHTTWAHFEKYFKPLGVPLYLTPGNHDNTWTAMLSIMRERHGGDHYAFTKNGLHFICFDTATPQEPVPSIDRRTLTWLENHLKTVDSQTPVFLFCHHPLSSGEFAKPYEQLRLLETIAEHNVVLLLMGHGHGVRHEKWAGLDSVMGGSTFGGNTGYGIVRVEGDRLAVFYRYRDEAKPMQLVLEKSIAPQPRRFAVSISDAAIQAANYGVVVDAEVRIQALRDSDTRARAQLTVSIDGDAEHAVEFKKAINRRRAQVDGVRHRTEVPVKELLPGRHFLRVHGTVDDEPVDVTREFQTSSKSLPIQVQRVQLDAGMKAEPLIIGQDIVVATTGGQIVRLSPKNDTLEPTVLHEAGVEILHAPAPADNTLYVPAAEKGVIALDLAGRVEWTCDVGSVVYGTPAVDAQHVYVGDLEGHIHAIRRSDGEKLWSEHHAPFSIEMPMVLHDGILLFGAWDGYLYAANCEDGKQIWKTRTPAGHEGGKFTSRYYAGADCRPIVMGDRIVMADRAYRVGWYTLDGKYEGDLGSGIPAVSLAADGQGFFARGDAAGLIAFDGQGAQRWVAETALGRFPIPPTPAGGRVYACSNRGRLHAVDADTGEVLWQYQVTPQLPVMAQVAATEDGVIVVADMDGVVTRLVDTGF